MMLDHHSRAQTTTTTPNIIQCLSHSLEDRKVYCIRRVCACVCPLLSCARKGAPGGGVARAQSARIQSDCRRWRAAIARLAKIFITIFLLLLATELVQLDPIRRQANNWRPVQIVAPISSPISRPQWHLVSLAGRVVDLLAQMSHLAWRVRAPSPQATGAAG